MNDEYFDIIDESGNIVGKATREECHSNTSLAHRTVHVLVFNSSPCHIINLSGQSYLLLGYTGRNVETMQACFTIRVTLLNMAHDNWY